MIKVSSYPIRLHETPPFSGPKDVISSSIGPTSTMVTFVRCVQDPRFGSSALDRALDAGKVGAFSQSLEFQETEGSRLLLVDDQLVGGDWNHGLL